jgi:hypothetical protein
MGQRMLTGIQLGKQSVLGTPVAATSIQGGVTAAPHRLAVNNIRPEEFRGDMYRFHSSTVVGRRGELRQQGYVCFDDICYLLGMAIKAGVTGVSDAGSPPAYTRTYTPAGTAVDTPELYTYEVGDDTAFYRYDSVFATSLQISAGVDGLTEYSADLVGRDRAVQAKTAALTQRDVEYAAANLWTWKIDDTGGTLGATAYGGCLLNFQWSIGAFQTFKCMDGTQVFTGISEQGLSAALAMTVMVDSSFSSLVTKYLNQSRLLVRLENLGSLIHGSSNTYKRLRLDGGYVLRNIAEIGGSDEAGKQTVSLEFESEYDIDEGLYYEVECVNSLAALP